MPVTPDVQHSGADLVGWTEQAQFHLHAQASRPALTVGLLTP